MTDAEFAAHGIAGARVDRIAANANEQLIYAYFGSKNQLFDAVLTTRFRALTEDVPITPDDLPGYVGRLFDYLVEHPDVLRLATWAGLERRPPWPPLRPTPTAPSSSPSPTPNATAASTPASPRPTCSPRPRGHRRLVHRL